MRKTERPTIKETIEMFMSEYSRKVSSDTFELLEFMTRHFIISMSYLVLDEDEHDNCTCGDVDLEEGEGLIFECRCPMFCDCHGDEYCQERFGLTEEEYRFYKKEFSTAWETWELYASLFGPEKIPFWANKKLPAIIGTYYYDLDDDPVFLEAAIKFIRHLAEWLFKKGYISSDAREDMFQLALTISRELS